MKKPWRKWLTIALAIVVGLTPASAHAINLLIPALLPDLCFVSCITWTHSTTLLEVQQVLGAAENLKASPNILTTISVIRGEIPAITASAAAAPPVHIADAAAATAATQAPADDAAATAAGNAVAACTGELCATQADATVNGQTASNTAKANYLHEQDTAQALAVQNSFVNDLGEEFGATASCPLCG